MAKRTVIEFAYSPLDALSCSGGRQARIARLYTDCGMFTSDMALIDNVLPCSANPITQIILLEDLAE